MLLTRWIKRDRLNIELEDYSSQLNFGLRNYQNLPIRFAKYKFNSNESQANLKTWLSYGSYENTQYIGFFELDSIRNWLNIVFTNDDKANFVTESFFIFDLDQVFSLNTNEKQISKVKLVNIGIDESIIRENNVLKYFNPPQFNVYYEDGTLYRSYSNSGEIDIVASNMGVYGILSIRAEDLMSSNKDPNDTLQKNYSVFNIELINRVLGRMRERRFNGVYDDLLNLDQLNDYFTKELQDIYFRQLDDLIRNSGHSNYQQIRDVIKKITILVISDDNSDNIRLNYDKRYEIRIGGYSRIFGILKNFGINKPSFNIDAKIYEYINKNFIGSLLNIASFLNNPITNRDTIAIFSEVNTIANEYYKKTNVAKNRYVEGKIKYTELKKLYGII